MRSSISYSAPSADELYREIDRLTVERDFVAQARSESRQRGLAMIEQGHPQVRMSRQCELLKLSRSSVYYDSGAVHRLADRDASQGVLLPNMLAFGYLALEILIIGACGSEACWAMFVFM